MVIARERERTAALARRAQIKALWANGLSLREIQDRMGLTASSLHTIMWQMRRNGEDLPFRYSYSPEKYAALQANGRLALKRLAKARAT